jgi:signal peptidase I
MEDSRLDRPKAPHERADRRELWWLLAATLLMVIPAFLIVKNADSIVATFRAGELPAHVFRMEGPSMEPTFKSGDTLFVFERPLSEIRRGDLVAFSSPGRGQQFIKRVIAVAGDVVEIRDGKLYLNGAVQDEPYIKEPTRYTLPPRTVPAGTLFVLGDNRNSSADSHVFGPVSGEVVLGVALLP